MRTEPIMAPEELFLPIDHETDEYGPVQLGSVIRSYSSEFPDWKESHLCLIGVSGRTRTDSADLFKGQDAIRREFRELVKPNDHVRICDLGNLKPGQSTRDTEVALAEICSQLLSEGVIPVVIGGSEGLAYGQYAAFEGISRNVEFCAVSPTFSLIGDHFAGRICAHEPNYLFNFTLLGYQSHFVDQETISTFKKMYFHPVRLGLLRNRLNEIEPVLRNTDVVAIDLNVLKAADHPGSVYANPNGLNSEEICQIAWYSGISEKMRSFGIYNYSAETDQRNRSARLAAQVLWYFADGYYNRKGDHPALHNEFMKYRCALDSRQLDIVFYKSKRTDRWWMEIPNPRSLGNKDSNLLIPCTYNDYKTATKGEMPERFWQALQKL